MAEQAPSQNCVAPAGAPASSARRSCSVTAVALSPRAKKPMACSKVPVPRSAGERLASGSMSAKRRSRAIVSRRARAGVVAEGAIASSVRSSTAASTKCARRNVASVRRRACQQRRGRRDDAEAGFRRRRTPRDAIRRGNRQAILAAGQGPQRRRHRRQNRMPEVQVEVGRKRPLGVLQRRERAGRLLALVGQAEQAEADAHIRLAGGRGRGVDHLERHRQLLVVREERDRRRVRSRCCRSHRDARSADRHDRCWSRA